MFSVLVLCCVFDRLLVVLGCHLGSFWAPQIHQHATYEVLFVVALALVFPLLLRSGESYGGPASVLFSQRFLHRFVVNSGIDLGSFWKALGGPSRSFWASIFA